MDSKELLLLAIFLAVAAFMAPLARRFQLGSVLGYLFGGMLIIQLGTGVDHLCKTVLTASGPGCQNVAQLLIIAQPGEIMHTAELGVAMFLFLIGLELKPRRLWSLRYNVFVVGGLQVAVTAVTLGIIGAYLAFAYTIWFMVGLAVALSSTAFALQIIEEKGELQTRHGRLAFSILLFQDIAAIPIIALVPVFAGGAALTPGATAMAAAQALGVIAVMIVAGNFLLDRLYRALASTGVREAMTASALLTVITAVLLMKMIGMSPALGAFVAGVLLADSDYRHQLASDIAPFEMMLLGVFFTAIGMSLDMSVITSQWTLVAAGVLGLVTVKVAVLYLIGRWQGLDRWSARRLALFLSQGGEFAFVIFAAAADANLLERGETNLLAVVVTLSMVTTPLLLLLDDWFDKETARAKLPDPEGPPKNDGHVVVAGFGRFGQIASRVLRARRIPFTALDLDAEQIEVVRHFGNKVYYGDASRLAILEAAEVGKARAFVLAIDDVEASLKAAELMRLHFPHVPVYARARNRRHVHRLMDLGVKHIERETFLSALELTRDVLRGLGLPEKQVRYTVDTFQEHDERRLYGDYEHYTDVEKLREQALKQSEELEQILAEDVKDAAPAKPAKSKTAAENAPPPAGE